MESILIVLVLAVLVFTVWNIISLYQIKKQSKSKKKLLNDPRYYELKYKYEFLVAVFSIIVTVGGLLGYNSINSAKQEIKKELSNELKPIDSIINITNFKIQENNRQVTDIENKQSELFELLPLSEKEILSQKRELVQLKNTINELNENNKVKQVFYMVDSIEINYSKNDLKKYGSSEYPVFEFKDLITNIGDKLPLFTKKPYVIPIVAVDDGVEVFNITKESFQAGATVGFGNDRRENVYFNVMIIENK